jgi:hypothetical protein
VDCGTLPNDWLSANTGPVFKKGDVHTAENYRPVSLTCVSCKILEHIICRHMFKHLENHKILTKLNHIDYKRQSSAKDLTWDLTHSGRSFMWHRKSSGPNTVLCGTPKFTWELSECSSSTICRHMFKHLENHKILTKLNHGFRAGYSCTTQLLVTTEDLLRSFDNNIQLDIAILDFSKAFDTVCSSILQDTQVKDTGL